MFDGPFEVVFKNEFGKELPAEYRFDQKDPEREKYIKGI